MKIIRLVVFLALGFICRSLLIFLIGKGGLLEYRSLLQYQDILTDNIQELKAVNLNLLEELEALSSDPEAVALRARELGYFRKDERIIKIEGYAPVKSYYTVGKIIRRSPGSSRQEWIFKLLGLVIPLILYLLSLLKGKKSGYAGRN